MSELEELLKQKQALEDLQTAVAARLSYIASLPWWKRPFVRAYSNIMSSVGIWLFRLRRRS